MAKDKLNPLKTKYEIELELDSIPYELTYKPVNKHILEKLNAAKDTNKEKYEINDAQRSKLKEIKDLKAVNDELLSTYGLDGGISLKEKTTLLQENKTWVREISSLTKELNELDKDLLDVNIAVEDYYKQMFDECVSGKDRVKFQKAVDDAGISYSIINVHLGEAVSVAQEKK